MNVMIDNKEVLSAGTCVVVGEQILRFDFSEKFKVAIKFVDDSSVGQSVKSNIENDVLSISLVNFDKSLGTAITRSLTLGTLGGRTVSLNLAAYCIGKEGCRSRIFHYTFFAEGAQ